MEETRTTIAMAQKFISCAERIVLWICQRFPAAYALGYDAD